MRGVAGEEQGARALHISESIYKWRWRLWLAVPICAALLFLPMPDAVRIVLVVALVPLVLVPPFLRLIGNFTLGYRGR